MLVSAISPDGQLHASHHYHYCYWRSQSTYFSAQTCASFKPVGTVQRLSDSRFRRRQTTSQPLPRHVHCPHSQKVDISRSQQFYQTRQIVVFPQIFNADLRSSKSVRPINIRRRKRADERKGAILYATIASQYSHSDWISNDFIL
jgi:hypothetical protein